jgi:hypothetical protein
MTPSLNQQSLFDEPAGPPTERRPPAEQHHDKSASGVAEYMRRKDREEQEERQQGSDLHGQATAGASAVYLLRWALQDDQPQEDPALPFEARKEAHRCKARLDALERARMTTDPADEDFVALRDSAYDAWPFDDDPMEVPHSSTDRADYEAYLASEWKGRWRHVVPTRIIKDAKEAEPSFL